MLEGFEDLTQEDILAYEQLMDPDDGDRVEATYGWSDEMNRMIVGMILLDRQFLVESLELIRPGYFENKAHRAIVSTVIDHFQEWKCMPTRPIIIEKLKHRFKDDEDRLFYLSELTLCLDAYTPGIDSRDYAISIITDFAKKQGMIEAMRRVLEEIKRGGPSDTVFSRINAHIDKARAIDRRFSNAGLDYFRELEDRYDRMSASRETRETFTTGFKKLDEALSDGGLYRGEIGSVIALPGVGKSLILTKASIANVLAGKRVLYISTEMDEDRLAQRFDAQFAHHDIRTLIENRNFVIPEIRRVVDEYEDKSRLRIIQFPPKTATVDTIRSFLLQLKMSGWSPDMVILDYVGECKDYPDMKTYESRERLVSEFRGLGVEENFCCLTAMQPNRAARDAQKEGVIDDSNLGDAFGQTRPLDAFWSINQRDDEKAVGVARIFVIKLRNGNSRFPFYVQFDQKTLEYREISERAYRNIISGYKEEVQENTKIDDFFVRREQQSRTSRFDTVEDPE